MMRPRFTKVLADFTSDPVKSALLVFAVAIGVFGVGSILGAYGVLTREMARNYRSTAPASMTIKVEKGFLDRATVQGAEGLTGVLRAERRSTAVARMRVGQDWYPLLLFVIDDFNDMRTNRFTHLSGKWPPPTGSMLIERTALQFMKLREADAISVKTPRGGQKPLIISGIVHDPGLAPARQEQRGYGYVTLATLNWLGEEQGFDELKIITEAHTQETIEERAQLIAHWLGTRGYDVHEIQVPSPGRHPHQGQMNAVLTLFIVFSFMTLVLSSILVSVSFSSLMTRQVREIGVMKAIGATPSQVSALYLLMVLIVCVLAMGIALPLSRFSAAFFVSQIAGLLNLNVVDGSVPGWVLLVQLVAGLLVPLAAAGLPVFRGGRISIREALGTYGVSQAPFGAGLFEAILGRIRLFNDVTTLSFRNVFRNRSRLAMTLLLLAAGGCLFMTALNTSKAWTASLERMYRHRLYDLEVRLNQPFSADKLVSRLRTVAGVRDVEAWGTSPAAFRKGEGRGIVHTYPDRGHGSFVMLGLPPSTKLVAFPVTRGRWLNREGSDDVVLNHMALAQEPNMKVGDRVKLSIDNHPSTWNVVGFVEDIGSPAIAYVSSSSYGRLMHTEGMTDTIRVALSNRDAKGALVKTREIEGALEAEGASVASTVPFTLLRNAIAEHMAVLVGALLAMASLTALVGTLGLMSTVSVNLLERTRELGVMRAIGATPGSIRYLAVMEAVIIAAMSLFFAFALSLPTSAFLGRLIGNMAFRTPLPLSIAPLALVLWAVLILVGAVLASLYPSGRASRLTVRDALSYE